MQIRLEPCLNMLEMFLEKCHNLLNEKNAVRAKLEKRSNKKDEGTILHRRIDDMRTEKKFLSTFLYLENFKEKFVMKKDFKARII